MLSSRIRHFTQLEAASGIILLIAAILALIIENSPWGPQFVALYMTPLYKTPHPHFPASPLEIVNNGLMTLFFLLISMEIKREFVEGELSTKEKAILPIIAACGGMLIPALIYFLFNRHQAFYLRGWAIPTATDIAFSLAVLSLVKHRIAPALKTFLLALALIDDLGAIIIIALFYTEHLMLVWLLPVLGCLGILILLNVLSSKQNQSINKILIGLYLVVGFYLWLCLSYLGVHATLAGVLLGLFLPLKNGESDSVSTLIEKFLHPWVAFVILPLFALLNAGFPLAALSTDSLFNTVSMGIILGLCLGKPLGIFLTSWCSVKTGWGRLPKGVTWLQLLGLSVICGMGFTMSLYIEALAFPPQDLQLHLTINLAVMLASLFSAVVGYCVLFFSKK